MTVNILMCTYNGEKYIREQLDSILGQSHKDFCIFVRDDGSTDKTCEIIMEYRVKYPEKIVMVDPIVHMGYPDCFWDILNRCDEADLYAFCDQDDVWDGDKLRRAVESFKQQPEEVPLLYIHDYDNCDTNLKRMSTHRLDDINTLTDMNILFYTYASGFSMVFNNAMRKQLKKMPLMGNKMYHDELCIWVAHFHGQILYDDAVLAKYRRHDATVTEYGNGISTLISNWFRREIIGREFVDKCNRIKAFLSMEKESDSDLVMRKFGEKWYLLAGGDLNISRYFKRLFFPMRLRPSFGGELSLRVLFLLNR